MTPAPMLPVLDIPFFDSGFFSDVFVFYMIWVVLFVVLGVFSRSGAVATLAGYMVFAVFAVETRDTILLTAFFAVTVTVAIFLGMQFFGFATSGGEPT